MASSIKILNSVRDVQEWRRSLGASDRVGFVPTMGALHAGHGALLKSIRPRCDFSVLSIFVNPTQFGPNEDLAKYPRTFERDLELARALGVDVVFAPTPDVMYPPGYSTYVEETSLTSPLCGAFRPGHFKGVTTVVLKLFNLVRPDLALFGLKDAQQFFVLHKMARDLNLGVSVEGMQTVREKDGLALSSRNAYLSPSDRKVAPRLYEALQATAKALNAAPGAAQVTSALAAASDELTRAGFKPQYLDCLRLPDFAPVSDALHPSKPYLLAVAAYLGTTRLIDNIIIRPELLKENGIQFS